MADPEWGGQQQQLPDLGSNEHRLVPAHARLRNCVPWNMNAIARRCTYLPLVLRIPTYMVPDSTVPL